MGEVCSDNRRSNTVLQPNERYQVKSLSNYEARRKALYKDAITKATKQRVKGLENKSKILDDLKNQKSDALNKVIEFLSDYIIKKLNIEYGDLRPNSNYKIEVK